MNLTELQIQLRSVAERISELQAEIEKMKPKAEDERKTMFEKITKMASEFPLENRKLSDTSLMKTYISCLAYISLADDSGLGEKLLFLARLSYGMGLSMSAEDIFKMGLEVGERNFDKICSELKGQKHSFLTDALILVNITEEATEASFGLIADIARIFECEKEDLCAAAMVAKAVLMEDFDILKQIPAPSENHWMGKFRQHIPLSWIQDQRIKCGTLYINKALLNKYKKLPGFMSLADRNLSAFMPLTAGVSEVPKENPCAVKKRLKAGTVVRKGEELVLYTRIVEQKQRKDTSHSLPRETKVETGSITAPCDGIVFYIERTESHSTTQQNGKYLEVYVVSLFDEYEEFCEWHKKISGE